MKGFIVLDIETTGINPMYHKITEIGAIKIEKETIVETFNHLINPMADIPKNITQLTGITNEMVKDKPTIEWVLPRFISFTEEYPILGHNIHFDYSFIKTHAVAQNLSFEKKALDTLKIARATLKELPSRSLGKLCDHYHISNSNAHRAYNDAYVTYQVYHCLKEQFYEMNPELFQFKRIQWKPKKQSPITDKQKKYLFSLIHRYDVTLETEIDTLTKSEASRIIDTILHANDANHPKIS